MKQTAIVILNWNGRPLLEQFLPSVIATTSREEADVVVVDNGSDDDSVAFLQTHYPEVKLVLFENNLGFAGGYNKALSGLDYTYVVILNSDVEVVGDWLQTAIGYLDQHPDVVALQPKLLSYKEKQKFEYAGAAGGYIDKYAYPFCRGRIFGAIEEDSGQYDGVEEVFWTTGACMIVRLKAFEDAGGFDERFFAHQEEIDLCWRFNARGQKLVCLPQSVVYHVGGATLEQENPRKTYLNFRNNLLMIYKNLPDESYSKVMFVRFFLDYLAAFQFVLQGKAKNARAVWRARHDFCKLKKEYKEIRQQNLNKTVNSVPGGMLRKSVLWEYYIGKKRKYSQL